MCIYSHVWDNSNDTVTNNYWVDCRPVAQLVEHRTSVREVMSSILAGPTLRVLKQLRGKSAAFVITSANG